MDMNSGGRISAEGARTGHTHPASDVDAIPRSALNVKGDLIVASGNDSFYVLPVGAEGTALCPSPAAPAGVTWSPVAQATHTHTQTQSHNSPDTDQSATAIHHTLGTGASQAAPGNHTHADIVPIGAIMPFAGTVAPAKYLVCDGSVVSQGTYPELFGVCGSIYGSAPSGFFRLPDLRGRAPMGVDSGQTEFSSAGASGGAKTVTLTEAQMPSHKHTASAAGLSLGSQTISGLTVSGLTFTGSASTAGSHSHTTSGSISGGTHTHLLTVSDVVTSVTANTNDNTAGSGGLTRVSSLNVTRSSVLGSTAAFVPGTDGAHSHTFTGGGTGNSGDHTHTVTGTISDGTISGGTVSTGTIAGTVDIANTGSGAAAPVLNPYLALTFIIKAL